MRSVFQMDLRQLNALVAVADHRSFSAAARALHTVQSNVSTHIARLERELGAALVDRTTGSLTDEGHSVVARARRIQSELASIDADVASIRDEIRGTVRLGVLGTTGRWLVPHLLETLGQRHPSIRMIAVDATTTSLLPQVADGRLDLALIQLPIDHPDVDHEVVFHEESIAIVPADHALAEYEEVDIRQLASHPLLVSPPGVTLRDNLDAAARRARVEISVLGEIDGMGLLASMAMRGIGPAIVPATAVAGMSGPFRVVHIAELPHRQVALAVGRRTRLSAPARRVREILLAVVRDHAAQLAGVDLVAP